MSSCATLSPTPLGPQRHPTTPCPISRRLITLPSRSPNGASHPWGLLQSPLSGRAFRTTRQMSPRPPLARPLATRPLRLQAQRCWRRRALCRPPTARTARHSQRPPHRKRRGRKPCPPSALHPWLSWTQLLHHRPLHRLHSPHRHHALGAGTLWTISRRCRQSTHCLAISLFSVMTTTSALPRPRSPTTSRPSPRRTKCGGPMASRGMVICNPAKRSSQNARW